jgi:hypothetical protein
MTLQALHDSQVCATPVFRTMYCLRQAQALRKVHATLGFWILHRFDRLRAFGFRGYRKTRPTLDERLRAYRMQPKEAIAKLTRRSASGFRNSSEPALPVRKLTDLPRGRREVMVLGRSKFCGATFCDGL